MNPTTHRRISTTLDEQIREIQERAARNGVHIPYTRASAILARMQQGLQGEIIVKTNARRKLRRLLNI